MAILELRQRIKIYKYGLGCLTSRTWPGGCNWDIGSYMAMTHQGQSTIYGTAGSLILPTDIDEPEAFSSFIRDYNYSRLNRSRVN